MSEDLDQLERRLLDALAEARKSRADRFESELRRIGDEQRANAVKTDAAFAQLRVDVRHDTRNVVAPIAARLDIAALTTDATAPHELAAGGESSSAELALTTTADGGTAFRGWLSPRAKQWIYSAAIGALPWLIQKFLALLAARGR